MRRKTIISLLFLMVLCFAKAQNLVPNYSFENRLQCISGGNQFAGYVSNWKGGWAGTCYFTSICNENFDSVPLNHFGHQNAHTGIAYAGIYTFASDTAAGIKIKPNKNLRNYIEDSLIYSLNKNVKYFITFYVSLGDTSWFYCNDIGAYFSDSLLTFNDSVKSYITPQVSNDPIHNPLSNDSIWVKISGSFIANGGEKYIVIGNFKRDSNSHVGYRGEVSSNEPTAYYFIDDVIVSPDSNYADSLESVNQLTIKKEQLKVYPNPSNGKFSIEEQGVSDKEQVEIYNMMGQSIYKKQINSTTTEIDISNEPKGIYLYRVTSDKGDAVGSGKLIIQ